MTDPQSTKEEPPLALLISSTALAVMLALLAMLGPFSIDTYLPAFPAIQQSLNATAIEMQQTLTVYMFSFAVMILWHGALSDSFGRRKIILVSLAIFAAATAGCAVSDSIEHLWLFRMLQGISAGAGVVIGRAIIRDLYEGAAAARLLSLVTMIFSIAPAIAPIIGGWIVKHLDWRAIFITLFIYAVLLLVYCWRRLPESLPVTRRQAFNPSMLYRNYRNVFSSLSFHLIGGTVAFNFSGMFLYVAAAPVFLVEHLGLGPDQFGWQFIPTVAGIFCGALTANRLSGRIPLTRQISIGFILLIGAALFNVGYHLFFPPRLPWSVAPLFFYTFGMSVVAPVATLLVLDLFPTIRGIVASCQSFTQTLLGALVAGAIAPCLSHSAVALALGQLAFTLTALALWNGRRLTLQRGPGL
ncbi:MAG: multidrug effflux MFS transporter [Oxalicibacterium faecigallinarum]|uniref:multidrug effflux MFS transporter n=1 Tax=Oxalicibacterium faecigallinarum TaxID=573741 RepID=UPI00280A36AD|nr:multidrug effflux MFS transporter [Oxalicibacterium faecigallinarum]MDQ7968044.1 multidrug effflux MFS transporter [Oxalicibacterium faecigallinarum]